MSMITAGDASSRMGPFSFFGSRSRVSWGAVIAGAVVAAATTLLLSLLGTAFGLASIQDFASTSGETTTSGVGAGIWTIINLALSMVLGGYVASRLSGTHSHLDGELHGITVWALAILIGLFASAHALSGLLGGVGFGVGQAVGPTAGRIALSSAAPAASPSSQRLFVDRFVDSLGASSDPTTMSREQIGTELRSLVGDSLFGSGSLSDADRARLVSLVAAQYGLTKDDAAQRVARMEGDVKARTAELDQRARAIADAVSQDVVTASRALFTALVLGLLGALVGAWLGTRHKRVLHPHETEVRLAPAVAHAGYGGVAEPASLSVYDDGGHLVAQYLRGVAFPVSKQDLLNLARSKGAGPALLRSIESLADRSYASASDVLAAIGTLP